MRLRREVGSRETARLLSLAREGLEARGINDTKLNELINQFEEYADYYRRQRKIEALIGDLSDENHFIRQDAAEELGIMHAGEAEEPLKARLNIEKVDGVKRAIEKALERIILL